MAWESDAEETQGGKDRSKLIWIGIAVIFVAMATFFLVPRGGGGMSTRAKVHHLQIAYDKTDSQAREEALALAVDVRARLVAGESFTRLARDYSHFSDVDPVWVYHGDWLDELDQLIWTLPVNEISNVIQTDYGFHLIRVIKREFSDADAYELELHERVLNDSRGGTEP